MKKNLNNIVLSVLLITSSSAYSKSYEKGKFWCNDRYLVKQNEEKKIYTPTELQVASKGYKYAVLGALALQEEKEVKHRFNLPDYIKEIPESHIKNKSGFEAKSFIISDATGTQRELVIAITGTNHIFSGDTFANLGLSRKQYADALEYFKNINSKHGVTSKNNLKVVVTGYSLGGALAGHLGKNPKVKDEINEVWLFNPSPRIYTSDYSKANNFWFGAATSDVLRLLRTKKFMRIFPQQNIAKDFYLVDSNDIYAHSRWITARNMLWAADLDYFLNKGIDNNPAMEFIKLSKFSACI